ncbi:hypothetical protein [Xanthomonas sp. XNM01]|uniref:hypothetical protein n=1 Tax=Xanthomonas sp. XNM01 TaxID=2769289 RepID=UPI00177DFD44|nr:hypothetical protein [Xanthomonas sp. XNM01]MBD9368137.1 hypothetical protein [Xanthomonas sp. XNM01]
MTIIRLLILLAVLAGGLVIGSLNSQRIVLDFGLAGVATTTGVALMVSALAGALLGGGIVAATSVIPLQARLRRAVKLHASASPGQPPSQER